MQCLSVGMAAHKRSDLSSCGAWAAGWGNRTSQVRGRDARMSGEGAVPLEVGKVDGTVNPKPKVFRNLSGQNRQLLFDQKHPRKRCVPVVQGIFHGKASPYWLLVNFELILFIYVFKNASSQPCFRFFLLLLFSISYLLSGLVKGDLK